VSNTITAKGVVDNVNGTLTFAGPVAPAFEPGEREERTEHREIKHVEGVQFLALEGADDARPSARVRVITAGMSLNRRLYPADVLAAAAGEYSRSKMMLNHPDFFTGYDMEKLAGIYGEAEWDRERNGVVADLHFLTRTDAGRTALAYAQEEIALRREGVLGPEDKLFGVSHVAYTEGKLVSADDKGNELGYDYYVVEKITEVLSGDFVVFDAADGKILELQEQVEAAVRASCRREGIDFGPEQTFKEVIGPTEESPRKRKWKIGNINVKLQ